ncbi:MAG TPA: hypothetical protein RMH99_10630 [Sandaracinaceae bacterium LLY-WYZ-13_1]|nr:hypothetical protein [Sandaracinaceae bacterium LLY-WYZ-13_1]
MATLLASMAVVVLCLGCRGPGFRTSYAAFGPYQAGPAELFQRAVSAAQRQGYQPTVVRPDEGYFVVPAHYVQRRWMRFGGVRRQAVERTTELRIQFYQGGYIEVIPTGELIRPHASRGWVSEDSNVREEVKGFTAQLASGLCRPAQATYLVRVHIERASPLPCVPAPSPGPGSSAWPVLPAAQRRALGRVQ